MASRLTFDPDQHIYRLDGARLKSVTTICGQMGKPQLIDWAARTAAEYAVDHWDNLSLQSPSSRRQEIGQAHNLVRDRKASSGTAIHAMAEALLRGDPVQVPPSMAGKVEGLAKWIELSGITVHWAERPVWTAPDPDYDLPGYAGTFDAIVAHPQLGVGLVDWKTGKGVYGDAAVQLAGYRAADWMVDGDEDAYMLAVDWLGVAHVQVGFTDLHTLTPEQAEVAAERFQILRRLSGTTDPKFRLEVTG
jgi:hypothetical protein